MSTWGRKGGNQAGWGTSRGGFGSTAGGGAFGSGSGGGAFGAYPQNSKSTQPQASPAAKVGTSLKTQVHQDPLPGVEVPSQLIEIAAKQNDDNATNAQIKIGLLLTYGKRIALDYTEASKYFKMASDKGSTLGMNYYGVCLEKGQGVAKDEKAAFELFKKTMDEGDADGCFHCARCYANGIGVDKDLAKAKEMYMRGKDASHPQAQCNLAMILAAEKSNDAGKLMQDASDGGSRAAMFNYGYYIHFGLFGTQKESEDKVVFEKYRKAADYGSIEGICAVGVCYEAGFGVGQNVAEAVKCYTRASRHGCAAAMFNLARCYENGTGLEKNLERALKLLKVAAEMGHRESMCNYAVLMMKDQKDVSVAVSYFRKAAEAGSKLAYQNYQLCLEKKMISEPLTLDVPEEVGCVPVKTPAAPVVPDANVSSGTSAEKKDTPAVPDANVSSGTSAEKKVAPAAAPASSLVAPAAKKDAPAAPAWGGWNAARAANVSSGTSVAKKDAPAASPASSLVASVVKKEESAVKKDAPAAPASAAKVEATAVAAPVQPESSSDLPEDADASQLYNYALRLEKGKGMDVDLKKAAHYYKLAADKGHAKAQCNYAWMLEMEKGDLREIVRYYKMSADQGNSAGLCNYGTCLETGKGIEKNIELAKDYYRRSAELGNRAGLANLQRLE